MCICTVYVYVPYTLLCICVLLEHVMHSTDTVKGDFQGITQGELKRLNYKHL